MQVEAARGAVQKEVKRILKVSTNLTAQTPTSLAAWAVAVYDSTNNGVWVELQGHSATIVVVSCRNVAAQSQGASTRLIMDIGLLSTLSPWMHKGQTL